MFIFYLGFKAIPCFVMQNFCEATQRPFINQLLAFCQLLTLLVARALSLSLFPSLHLSLSHSNSGDK